MAALLRTDNVIIYRSALISINKLIEAWYIYNIELYSAPKKCESIICRKVDETKDDCVKQNKSDSEKYHVFSSRCGCYILYRYIKWFVCMSWRISDTI